MQGLQAVTIGHALLAALALLFALFLFAVLMPRQP